MRIGLLGFGVVGKGVYDIAADREDIHIAKVVCLEDISLPDATVTRRFADVLEDDTIDTVVEAMGGLHPAYEFVRSAIEAGKNIVTSNKALVATYYDELIPLAERMGVHFRCTAAVGGGIGWLSELQRARRAQSITAVGGIMNGTCNYILDSMTRLGLGYDEALHQAQALGYAEANPTTDIDGIDTWHKIILSANIAFGISMDHRSVPVSGIRHILAEDIAAFHAHGLTCKLVSTARHSNHVYSAYVQPTLFSPGALEAAVPSNYNLITLVGEFSERMSFFGQGAGRYPTAYNVVQDCIDLMNGVGFYCHHGAKTVAVNEDTLCYYVRGAIDNWLTAHTAEHWGNAAVTHPVSVREMHSWLQAHPGTFVAALNRHI